MDLDQNLNPGIGSDIDKSIIQKRSLRQRKRRDRLLQKNKQHTSENSEMRESKRALAWTDDTEIQSPLKKTAVVGDTEELNMDPLAAAAGQPLQSP